MKLSNEWQSTTVEYLSNNFHKLKGKRLDIKLEGVSVAFTDVYLTNISLGSHSLRVNMSYFTFPCFNPSFERYYKHGMLIRYHKVEKPDKTSRRVSRIKEQLEGYSDESKLSGHGMWMKGYLEGKLAVLEDLE